MRFRFLLLAFSAALVSATPLTLEFVGFGSGSLDGVAFTNQSFTFTFDTNTDVLFAPPYAGTTSDATTPDIEGTFTTIMDGLPVVATLTDLAIFDNPIEDRLGLWEENEDTDWLTITAPVFGSYALTSNLSFDGNSSEVTALSASAGPVETSAGPLEITSSSALDFTATVTPAVTTTPEPSTASLLLVGTGGILLGLFRRRARP